MGRYHTEYDWISASILKSRTPLQVRRFAEKMFNEQRIAREDQNDEAVEGDEEEYESNDEDQEEQYEPDGFNPEDLVP
jgi:hypothetical protein